ncbi:hypothetical protein NA57DRAFT_72330 [Rhizodiscina lignyota]|uniref:Uncharacterized protein n=1 Tax=Rhizodiscina lignyota TaxID=1504668 RepID=A0A9P4IPL5_9PEZI|nr:hypothetical protein NA57DRAFT_72330 [Rhizodiscina lignyota]
MASPLRWMRGDAKDIDSKVLEFRCMVYFYRHMRLTESHCLEALGPHLRTDEMAVEWIRAQRSAWVRKWQGSLWDNEEFHHYIRNAVEATNGYASMTGEAKTAFWRGQFSMGDAQRWLHDFEDILKNEYIAEDGGWCEYTRGMFVAAAKATYEHYVGSTGWGGRLPTEEEKAAIGRYVAAASSTFMPTPPPAWQVPVAVRGLWGRDTQ